MEIGVKRKAFPARSAFLGSKTLRIGQNPLSRVTRTVNRPIAAHFIGGEIIENAVRRAVYHASRVHVS
jgi:hypothetical protein